MRVNLDYTNVLAETIGERNGIRLHDLRAYCESSAPALSRLKERMDAGEVGFAELPRRPEFASQTMRCSARLRDRSDTLIVIGMGGSALGAQALRDAFEPGRSGAGGPEVLILDNIDPEQTAELLKGIDPSRTAVNIVTKSGGTAETLANFMVVHSLLTSALSADEVKKRFVVTTDPDEGELGSLAREEGFDILPIPKNVGGRFSVLSPAGLLPAAYLGLDIEEMLGGARGALEAGLYRKPQDNPALISAAIHVYMMKEKGKSIRVFFPYSSSLLSLARWCAQLWAESLGKREDREGHVVNCGQTPVVALGAVDQHSQVQLYMDGPEDKIITFIEVNEPQREVKIPQTFKNKPSCACLAGKTLKDLIEAEKTATELALAEVGRPSVTLSIPSLSPLSMGEIIILMEYETAIAGEILGINAFDQPGVEQGKKYTYALMGRKGSEAARDEIMKKKNADRFKA